MRAGYQKVRRRLLIRVLTDIYASLREEKLDFSKTWSITSAIRETLRVDLHPTFTAASYLFLSEQKSFEQVRLRVAKRKPEILLVKHRLYLYEYATSPPLRELRIVIKSDEGPIEEGDVAFKVSCGDPLKGFYLYYGLPLPYHRFPTAPVSRWATIIKVYLNCKISYIQEQSV
jgi:hypothetical protein